MGVCYSSQTTGPMALGPLACGLNHLPTLSRFLTVGTYFFPARRSGNPAMAGPGLHPLLQWPRIQRIGNEKTRKFPSPARLTRLVTVLAGGYSPAEGIPPLNRSAWNTLVTPIPTDAARRLSQAKAADQRPLSSYVLRCARNRELGRFFGVRRRKFSPAGPAVLNFPFVAAGAFFCRYPQDGRRQGYWPVKELGHHSARADGRGRLLQDTWCGRVPTATSLGRQNGWFFSRGFFFPPGSPFESPSNRSQRDAATPSPGRPVRVSTWPHLKALRSLQDAATAVIVVVFFCFLIFCSLDFLFAVVLFFPFFPLVRRGSAHRPDDRHNPPRQPFERTLPSAIEDQRLLASS